MSRKPKPTLIDFIPGPVAEQLEELGRQVDLNADRIGDLAVMLADHLAVTTDKGYRKVVDPRTEDVYPISKLWKAIGDVCGQTGSTIRGWERYNRLFTPDLREKYDMLNRSQRKFMVDKAQGEKQTMIENIDQWLDQAPGGNVGSYATMIRWWKKKEGGGDPQWESWFKSAHSACEKIIDFEPDEDQPPPPNSYKLAARAFIGALVELGRGQEPEGSGSQAPGDTRKETLPHSPETPRDRMWR